MGKGKENMKVCKMGLESIWINHACGDVRMCGWTRYVIGNLLENSIEQLWHGEKAKKFRESLEDGSYKYCDSNKCPYLANHTLETLLADYKVPDYPKYCSLSYEEQCNYVCRFCRDHKYIPEEGEEENYKKIETEVNKFINQLDTLSANGVGEVFCSPSILNVLKKVKLKEHTKIVLESNGSLFNENNWRKIENLGKHDLEVIITLHSFNEDTYQFLSGTSLPISNMIHNLKFIQSLRQQGIIKRFEIATVVCERNFREMPDFVKQSLEFEPDSIRLRFFEPYGVKNKSVEWFMDIRNPYHPYHDELKKIMNNPVFDHPIVWKWQGDSLPEYKDHPYFEEQLKVSVLSKLLIVENIGEKLKKYFEQHAVFQFALYGNSYIGQSFAALLDRSGIDFEVIFDTYALNSEFFGKHNIKKPETHSLNHYDLIIITSASEKEIRKNLTSLGYEGNVIYINELIRLIEEG